MREKGSIFLNLLFIAIIVIGSYYIWSLRDKIDILPKTLTEIKPTSSPVTNEYKEWKDFTDAKVGLSFKIPPDWTISDDNVASQFQLPLTTSDLESGRVYNSIKLTTHTGVLYAGVYDVDLFNSLYSSETGKTFNPNFLQNNGSKFTKISSGKILTGQKFVVFSLDPEKGSASIVPSIQGYILKSDSLIILTLNNYDEVGINTFKQILPTASLPR